MHKSGDAKKPDIFAVAAELQAQMEAAVRADADSHHSESVVQIGVQSPLRSLAQLAKGQFGGLWPRKALSPPMISVIIPVYNKASYTLRCLESLSRQVSRYSFEVIVIDNGSADETLQIVATLPGLRYIRNQINQGFVDGCNQGVRAAKGDIIVLLNNDTAVHGGWLDTLVNRLTGDQTIGLVGSKLVYPDGRLQEAGSILFSDASGHNYGKGGKADSFEYNYSRDVDYCSGASIAFYRSDFEKLGGFDQRYAPAYYEDADLAMSIRYKLNKRIVYEPHSVLTHIEGGTAGTDESSGYKRYQAINKEKFFEKWRSELAKHHYSADTNPTLAARYGKQKRLLIVDGIVPEDNRDSGSLRMTQMVKAALKLDYAVTFFPDNRVATLPYTANLQALGVEVVYGGITPKDFHQERKDTYATVLLSRPLSAFWHLAYCKAYQPSAKLIYDTVDLHYLRISRQAEVEKKSNLNQQAELWKQLEYYLMDNTDRTLVVSYEEQSFLQKDKPSLSVSVVSNINPEPQSSNKPNGYKDRDGLLFIGSYDHLPNRDAVTWFVKDLFPGIQQKLPKVSLELLGSKPNAEVRALASSTVQVPGFIDNVLPNFAKARVFVCPLRYGAGVKGKVSQALANGVPIVSTSIGVEGMHLKDGYDCLIADSPSELIKKIVSLYSDEKLWEKIRKNAFKTYRENFSEAAGLEALRHAFEDK